MTDPHQYRDLSDDDLLVACLGDALDQADPVPPDAVAAARDLYGLRRADEELATLIADSLFDEVLLVRQGQPAFRQLSFRAIGLSVDVEVAEDGRTVTGAVSPPAAVVVEIETTAGSTETRTDDLGRFEAPISPGRWRLHVQAERGTVVTPWIVH